MQQQGDEGLASLVRGVSAAHFPSPSEQGCSRCARPPSRRSPRHRVAAFAVFSHTLHPRARAARSLWLVSPEEEPFNSTMSFMHIRSPAATPWAIDNTSWSVASEGEWVPLPIGVYSNVAGRKLYKSQREAMALTSLAGASTIEIQPQLADGQADDQPQLRKLYGLYARHRATLHNDRPVYSSSDGVRHTAHRAQHKGGRAERPRVRAAALRVPSAPYLLPIAPSVPHACDRPSAVWVPCDVSVRGRLSCSTTTSRAAAVASGCSLRRTCSTGRTGCCRCAYRACIGRGGPRTGNLRGTYGGPRTPRAVAALQRELTPQTPHPPHSRALLCVHRRCGRRLTTPMPPLRSGRGTGALGGLAR